MGYCVRPEFSGRSMTTDHCRSRTVIVTEINASSRYDPHACARRNRRRSMDLRSKRRGLQAVNGAVGLVLGLGGYIGQLYSNALATFFMFAVWIAGATLINLLTEDPNKK
jgi:hypothetical protein